MRRRRSRWSGDHAGGESRTHGEREGDLAHFELLSSSRILLARMFPHLRPTIKSGSRRLRAPLTARLQPAG